jgi:Cutinase
MGEGPSSTIPAPSPEIEDFDAAQNLISGDVLNVPVPYPTVYASGWDVLDAASMGPLTNAVNAGESALQSYVATWASGCPLSQDKIALVGYSMGAWVINKWLNDHPGEWIMISAVVLYGDPCWKDGSDAGLARIFNAPGCSSAQTYPYPAPDGPVTVPFQIQGLCAYHDPVCGGGYGDDAVTQLAQALACDQNSCPHLHYTDGAPGSGPLMEGAKFVVQQLTG